MSKREIQNLAASVRARLTNLARERGEDVQASFVDFARERFFARLEQSPHANSVVLKGAALFRVWEGEPHRVTRDSDFLKYGASTPEAVAELVRDVCRTVPTVPDGLEFQIDTVRADEIRAQADYDGVRVRFAATLDRARIPLQIDFGFGDTVVPDPVEVVYPSLLDFAEPRLRAYPRETVVAEKFQATVALGETNTRFKDFYDIWYLADRFPFSGEPLARAIEATFRRRSTLLPTTVPVALTDAHAEASAGGWRAFVNRSLGDSTATPALLDVAASCRAFLMPVARGLTAEGRFAGEWPPGGTWGS